MLAFVESVFRLCSSEVSEVSEVSDIGALDA